MSEELKRFTPLLINSRLGFSFDPDTGLLAVEADASFRRFEEETHMLFHLWLTPETSRMLLEDLPKLEALLVRAKEGRTKPDFLQ